MRVTEANTELEDAFRRLVPQLTPNSPPPTQTHLASLVADPSSTLMIAREPDVGGRIVGSASLAIYRVPTGVRAIIEDVVVDGSFRGRGIGRALLTRLLEEGRAAGAAGVTLTSNPERADATRLYLRLGFSRRNTNAYFYRFG